jgi:hypothetical protein
MVTKGKSHLPKTSRWYCAGVFLGCYYSFALHSVLSLSLSFSRASKSNKKTANATGAAVQANSHDVNQPGPVVALNDYNEYITNLLMVTTS